MEHNIDAIREEAERLLYELNTKAHFEEFTSDRTTFCGWLYKYRKDIPSFIKFASGCTRFVFWDANKSDYVFKMNIYVDDIDYGRQEEYIYNKAVEAGVAECFAWVHKIIDDGMRSIYAMPYCIVDYYKMSSDSYEYHVRQYCDEMGYDFDHLTDDQRDEVNDMVDGYSDSDGMMDYVSDRFGSGIYDLFCSFVDDIGLNDLHCGNWGYLNGQLVVIDYAGYGCHLMQEVA